MQAELDRDVVDGFTIFKEASPRGETVEQSEASFDGAQAARSSKKDSGAAGTSPLPKQDSSGEETIRQAPRDQYLPVRNVIPSNYGLSTHHEFQAKQSLSSDPSSTLLVPGFDEIISNSTNEMGVTSDGITSSSNAVIGDYMEPWINDPSQVCATPFSGVTPQFESEDYEKLGGPAASYSRSNQSHMSQTPEVEGHGYITEETWDFSDMNVPDNFYVLMDMGPVGQEALREKRPLESSRR